MILREEFSLKSTYISCSKSVLNMYVLLYQKSGIFRKKFLFLHTLPCLGNRTRVIFFQSIFSFTLYIIFVFMFVCGTSVKFFKSAKNFSVLVFCLNRSFFSHLYLKFPSTVWGYCKQYG